MKVIHVVLNSVLADLAKLPRLSYFLSEPAKEKPCARSAKPSRRRFLAPSSQLTSNLNSIEIQYPLQMLWDFQNGMRALTDGRVISRRMEYDENPNHLVVSYFKRAVGFNSSPCRAYKII